MLRADFGPSLSLADRAALMAAVERHPSRSVRLRASWLLALARAEPAARVARRAGCSRPLLYRLAGLYLRWRSVEALDPAVTRHLTPWPRPPRAGRGRGRARGRRPRRGE